MNPRAELIAVARREKPAELVLKNGQVLNIFNGALETRDIAVHSGFVAGLGDYEAQSEIDLKGSVVVPGFIDAHIHLESSMLRPEEIAKVLLSKGTTTVIAEPHEIANVAGLDGLRYFTRAVALLPVDVFFMVPSSVPSTSPDLETNGGEIDVRAVSALLDEEGYIGLGEVMDYPGVIHGNSRILEKIEAAKGKPIDGHAPGMTGFDLNAYLAAGPDTDHETTELWEGHEKLAKGMKLIIRESSVSKDFSRLLPLINYITARRCMLATDDKTAIDLATEGGINMLVKLAIEREIDPRLAVQMVTLNPAEHYGLSDRGAIAAGMIADLVILEDLTSVYIRTVFKKGIPVYADGRFIVDVPHVDPPRHILESITVKGVAPEHFLVDRGAGKYRVIGFQPGQIVTEELTARLTSKDGHVQPNPAEDVIRISIIDRYSREPRVANGFVKGFGFGRGAIATSVSHDAHNIAVVGVDTKSMATAVNAIIRQGGGMSVALEDAVLAELPLKIAGLMSTKPFEAVVGESRALIESASYLGSQLDDPFIALSFMSLATVPALKITDKGLVDVANSRIVDLKVEESALGKAA
ncbi:MAG: adenine deaminase [Candidatus Aquicultorales bacterium]